MRKTSCHAKHGARQRSLPLAAALMLAAGAVSCPVRPEEEPVIRTVRTAAVSAVGFREQEGSFAGVLEAELESRLSFRVPGGIVELAVDAGGRVEAGDLIARLDPADYELQLEQAEAALQQAEAKLFDASAALERVSVLYEEGAVAASDLDAAQAAHMAARGAVNAAETARNLAQRQLRYTELRAPADGSVTVVPVELEENVDAGMPVAILSGHAGLEARVGLPAAVATAVDPGDRARVYIPELADGVTRQGTVLDIAAGPHPLGAMYATRVRLDETPEGALSGMAAEVTFAWRETFPGPRFLLPLGAVSEDHAGTRFVYRVERLAEGFGALRKVPAAVESRIGERLVVDADLAEGDLVVVRGVSRVRPGQRVRIADEEGRLREPD